MGTGAEIRKKLPLCGDCTNCKLLVWEETSELQITKTLIKFKSLDGSYYFSVRCSWLKSPVAEPQFMTICEGRQGKNND